MPTQKSLHPKETEEKEYLGHFLSKSLPGAGPCIEWTATQQHDFGSKVLPTECYFISVDRKITAKEINPLLCQYWKVKKGRTSTESEWGFLWMPAKGESDGFTAVRILNLEKGHDEKRGIEVEVLTVWN